MRYNVVDLAVLVLTIIISCIFTYDILFSSLQFGSFDIPFHITNIAQFYLAIQHGDFPVVWTDGFANYGLPMGIISHQLPIYLGALLTYLTHNPTTSLNILAFISIIGSAVTYYAFLRKYFSPVPAFVGVFLFNFGAYRILNFYIRGAIPELFAGIFLPIILLSLYQIFKNRSVLGYFILWFSVLLLTLTHPMMLVIYTFIFGPYILFLLYEHINSQHNKKAALISGSKLLLSSGVMMFLGVLAAAYYIIPLVTEIKYFYYGQSTNHLTDNSYLRLSDFFSFQWEYFKIRDIFTRGHNVFPGLIEVILIIGGLVYFLFKLIKDKSRFTFTLADFAAVLGIIVLLFTINVTDFFYQNISILSNIQFPWRMLSAFVFLPPIVIAYIFTKYKSKVLIVLFVILVSLLSFPQLYGKNKALYPQSMYYFTKHNVHSILMNTIWTGKTEEYPVKQVQAEVIGGDGNIISSKISNSSRNYKVEAKTDLQLVDYTFYFPGWHVYADKNEVEIQFQDPNYRGVITYTVPPNTNEIDVIFEDTKIRLLSKYVSVFVIIFVAIIFVSRRKLVKYID